MAWASRDEILPCGFIKHAINFEVLTKLLYEDLKLLAIALGLIKLD